MAVTGVDGTVELVSELDRQTSQSSIARNAPRSSQLYGYLSEGMRSGHSSEEFHRFAIELIQRLGIWWSPEFYSTMPTLVPWCIRDRSCRHDQGPESWGSPRSDGYLRDDNSIIKKLPLPLLISGPHGSTYRGRKPWRGFTACHIWRDLQGGEVAGADPWLYSFVPNLIWLPSWLAPLTDRQGSEIQAVLQRTSIALFRGVEVRRPVSDYAELSWRKLPAPTCGVTMVSEKLHMFSPVRAFFTRRINYLDKFVKGCDEVLASRPLSRKLICSRYTLELPTVELGEIGKFRASMADYQRACSAALAAS